MLNILDSGGNIPFSVLGIVYFQGHLSDGNKKDGTFICNQFMNHIKEIYPAKNISDIVMFDGSSNVWLAGIILKVNYPKIIVMRGVEHKLSLFFNGVPKIPIVNKMISSHKMIYNIFGYGIYHKPHSIFKSKSQDFHNRNIGLFSGNEAILAGYFMGIHRYLYMQKFLQATILSA